MTRTEIVDQAKQIVLSRGPANCLEFTSEIIAQDMTGRGQAESTWDAEAAPEFKAIYAEVTKQAVRVYRFLGYDAPFGLGG